MASSISTFVIKILSENQGCLDFASLEQRIRQRFTIHESILHEVLHDGSRFAIQDGQKVSAGLMSPESLIVAKTSLRLCQKRRGECAQCDRLHLCRYLVCGCCRYGVKCIHSHDLASPYNTALLANHGLQDLREKQVFQLLLQNDPYLLPEICPHYNKGDGEHGSCKFASSCIKLHLCQHFVLGDCAFGSSCNRAHTKDDDTMKLFSGRGYSTENIQMFEKIFKNKCIIFGIKMGQGPADVYAVPPVVRDGTRNPAASFRRPITSDGGPADCNPKTEKNEICLFFIRGNCSFKERCVYVHFHLPYKWQVLEKDGMSWKDFPNMEEIEKAYCDPTQNTSAASCDQDSVNFLTMTYQSSPVRRLSTASSVSKPLHFILTTQWLWYWKNDGDMWVEYSLEDTSGVLSSITSKTLENVYQEGEKTEIHFTSEKQKYILNIKEMYEQNKHPKMKREVRRRPRFISAQEVELKLRRDSAYQGCPLLRPSYQSGELQPQDDDRRFCPGGQVHHRMQQSNQAPRQKPQRQAIR